MPELNESLILAQPWFSAPGHPAHYTLLIARALCDHTSTLALVYSTSTGPADEWFLNELTKITPVEIIKQEKTNLAAGTWRLYHHLLSLAKKKSDYRKVLFLDASLATLALAMVWCPLPRSCQITAIELYGPEKITSTHLFKQGIIRLLLYLATKYRALKIAFRTPELKISWQKSGLVAPETCITLPTLELTQINPPLRKMAVHQRNDLIFALAGQLRPQKNIARIVPLFRDGFVSGKLLLAGPISGDVATTDLSTLRMGANGQIIFEPRFLSEPELNKIVGEAHYNLMLYADWDDRMESAMLFTAIRVGTPIIGRCSGWLGRMIKEYELGYAIDPYNPDEIRACLSQCALPGSSEYERFEQGIRRILTDHQQSAVVPNFLAALGSKT